jgi:hypothetical protein
MKPIRWTLSLLLAVAVAGVVKALIFSWQSQHSGPFAYFQDAPGKGTVLERGTNAIKTRLQDGSDARDLEKLLGDAGFECAKEVPPAVLATAPKPDENGVFHGFDPWLSYQQAHGILPAYHRACIHHFGFFYGGWLVTFYVDQAGLMRQPVQTVSFGLE